MSDEAAKLIAEKAIEAQRALRMLFGTGYRNAVAGYRELLRNLVESGVYPNLATALHGCCTKIGTDNPEADNIRTRLLAAFADECQAAGVKP